MTNINDMSRAEPVDEAWILHLARETMAEAIGPNKGYQYLSGERDEYDCMKGCVAAIRRTLAHRGARWPGEAELREMAESLLHEQADNYLTVNLLVEMARRLRAHMTGETE
jgi:hypothetical protein